MANKPIISYLEKFIKPIGEISQPSLKHIGIALGALTEAGLYRIGYSKVVEFNARENHTLQKNLKKLALELEKKEENQITQAPSEIAHPIMERLSYIDDDHLSDLFVELLTKASTKEGASKAHPAFIATIDQLSPDEAILLQEMKKLGGAIEYIEYGSSDIRPEKSNQTSTICKYFSKLSEVKELVYAENIEFYMENLLSLGLLQILEGNFLPKLDKNGKNVPSDEYKRLADIAENSKFKIEKYYKFYTKIGVMNLTSKGFSFLNCVAK